MLEEFVKQAKRLFSSKNNGGKQVPQLIDQLHNLKQVLLAVALVLMIGYSQFRDHFKCQPVQSVKQDVVTNLCLVNGTTTVQRKDSASSGRDQPLTHVGLAFMTDKEDQRVTSHIYTRDLWFILIMLAAGSFIAQRFWAYLFQNEVLQALLQLVGSESSQLVKAAEAASPYKLLAADVNRALGEVKQAEGPASERVTKAIEIVDEHVNIYDHKLDYYPNQLIYLLLTRSAASYKMSNLNLRRRLFLNSVVSSLVTASQFLIPLYFIGPEYWTYGWRWLLLALDYVWRVTFSFRANVADWNANSIDYELSSSIFPVSVQCEVPVYGMDGSPETQTTFCTAGINEICAKLFPWIWLFVVVNIPVELLTLVTHTIAWLGPRAASTSFGRRCWPGARKEADLIAMFRHRRAMLLEHHEQLKKRNLCSGPNDKSSGRLALSRVQLDLNNNVKKGELQAESAHERKRLEAEDLEGGRARRRHADQKWPRRMLRLMASSWLLPGLGKHTEWRRRRLTRETRRDINIYPLLYLLHLRLGKSRSRSEEVIRMTAQALAKYLAELEKSLAEARRESCESGVDGADEPGASESDYKSDSGENEALNVNSSP